MRCMFDLKKKGSDKPCSHNEGCQILAADPGFDRMDRARARALGGSLPVRRRALSRPGRPTVAFGSSLAIRPGAAMRGSVSTPSRPMPPCSRSSWSRTARVGTTGWWSAAAVTALGLFRATLRRAPGDDDAATAPPASRRDGLLGSIEPDPSWPALRARARQARQSPRRTVWILSRPTPRPFR
jgi:hypothetical protein